MARYSYHKKEDKKPLFSLKLPKVDEDTVVITMVVFVYMFLCLCGLNDYLK